MTGPLGIEGIRARIGQIESILGIGAPPQGASLAGVTPDTSGFEPFGEKYQQAVEAVAGRRMQTGASFTANGALSTTTEYATPLPPGSPGAVPVGGADHDHSQVHVGEIAGAGARPIGGYGPMRVPAELQAYGNGRIPTDRLARISQGNHRLFAPAAAAWDQVVAAARAAGFELRITDSYRSYEGQVDLARRKGLYSQGGLAAVPGTSNHGWGLAVDADVRDPALLAWVRENAPRFGWVEAVPREPWHWEYRPHQV